MLQTLSGNRAKILAFTIAIAMILLYTMSFATTVFADSDNDKQPDKIISSSQDDSDDSDDLDGEKEKEKKEKDNNNEDVESDDDSNTEDKDKDKDNGNAKDDTDTTGTQVKYHIQLSNEELNNLEQIKLTITFEDENGDTVTDEVIVTAADRQGNFFKGNFAGTYRENTMTIVGYEALITWTNATDSTYEIDHQSNNGFGANSVINVFTKGKAVTETEPEDLDDDEGNSGDSTGENGDSDGGSSDQGSTGNTTGTTTNNSNTTTITETPAPQGAVIEVADDTTNEMVQIISLEEEATPLAEAPVDDVPQTGVAEDTALWMLMLLGSLTGIAVLARKRDTIME